MSRWCNESDYGMMGDPTSCPVILRNGSTLDTYSMCYYTSKITSSGSWKNENPLDFSLPLFITQLVLVTLVTRLFIFLLKPLRQPRVIADIIGGIALGPSGLGSIDWFARSVYPVRSILLLETLGNVGLLYFLFLVGLEMDLSVVRRTGRKTLLVALAGMGVPFLIAGASSLRFIDHDNKKKHYDVNDFLDTGMFVLFFGSALSVTAFTVLARILAELKLLTSELGRLAMSSAIVIDMMSWIVLALAIALSENRNANKEAREQAKYGAFCAVIGGVFFVGVCVFLIRPGIEWIIRKTPEGESFSDFHICLILTGVMFCGFATDAIGTHSIFGAFLFGLVIPNGPLASTLIEKLEDFVTGLLLPLFFLVSGIRFNFRGMTYSREWFWMFCVICLCSFAKIGATFFAAVYLDMPTTEAAALGLLMNTKGLNEIIVLNIGRQKKVFDDESFALMVILAIVTTGILIPTVTAVYRPGGRFVPNKRRTIQKSKPDTDLRLLACIHNPRNVPTIISLLDISHPNKRSPICLYALQLVELTGRASAMLIVHNTRKSGRPALNRTQAQSDQIVNAFDIYQQNATFVTVQPLTAVSPYSTMHEDICNLAEDKRVSFIVLPFHKQPTIDGGMEETNPAFRTVNQNVLANAPCSVGILVDRGLGASTKATNPQTVNTIVVLFFGGPDDREALAYALRMSENPGVSLTVHRFIPGDEARGWSRRHDDDSTDNDMLSVVTDHDRERQMDEDSINDFRMKTTDDESVVYMEKVTNSGEETASAIRSMDNSHDLYIVGRGQGTVSPLTEGLTDWSECPELGVIGDILASADFASSISVLVVQQYVGMGPHGDGVSSTDSPAAAHQSDQPFEQQPSRSGGPTNNYGTGNQPWQKVYRH